MLSRTNQKLANISKIDERTDASNSNNELERVQQVGAFDPANSPQDNQLLPEPVKGEGKKRSIFSTIFRGLIQIILMVGVLAGSYMAMNQLINAKPEIRKRPGFRTVYTVETLPAVLGDHRPSYKVYGQAAASRTVDLRSLVSGEVIAISPKLKAGALVRKGDALVEIDAFNFDGALREAKANRNEALARIKENESRIEIEKSKIQRLGEQLVLARDDHKRIAGLRANGTTTQKQLDDRAMALSQRAQAAEQSQLNLQAEKAKLEQQNASLVRLDWRIQLAERNLRNTILKAPFDGIVRTTGVEIGKTVNANDVVVSIYEEAKIDIRFTLTDERYGRLQADESGLLGRKLTIVWMIGGRQHSYPAIIDRVGAEISSSRGGVEVYANLQQVEGNPKIRPGAFVEIHVPDILFTNTTMVPETAIYDGNRIYLKNGHQLASKPVEVLAYNEGKVIISGDISSGDRILVTRIAEISDGIRVREEGEKAPSDRAGKNRKNNGKIRKPGSKTDKGS